MARTFEIYRSNNNEGVVRSAAQKTAGCNPDIGLFHEGRPGTFEPNSGYET
jgi:hypothetical protein